MELALLLYVASIAENFRTSIDFFQIIFFIVGLLSIFGFAFSLCHATDNRPGSNDFENAMQANRLARKVFVVCFFAWTAVTLALHLMPTRRDVYVMAGGYVALSAIKSNVVQTTADNALNSIEKWLDKELSKELAKETESKKGSK